MTFNSSTLADSVNLCEPDEQVIFSCVFAQQIASLCAAPDFTHQSGYLQYRYGSPDEIHTFYPSDKRLAENMFFLSSTPYSGGGANMIRFQIAGQDIFLFDRMIRTHFVAGEPNYPEFSAGRIIQQADQLISTEYCDDESASIRAPAFEHLQREPFNHRILP